MGRLPLVGSASLQKPGLPPTLARGRRSFPFVYGAVPDYTAPLRSCGLRLQLSPPPQTAQLQTPSPDLTGLTGDDLRLDQGRAPS
jgi:hypothetical protein